MQATAPATVKIAILLSHRVDVAGICRARNMARLLLAATGASGEQASIVIGLPDMPGDRRREAEETLREGQPHVIVRPLLWDAVPVANVRRMFPALDPMLDLDGIDTIVIPRDWGWNFADCDAWISMADPGIGAVLPLRPTAHFCRDLAVRIVPDAFATGIADPYWDRQTEAFRLWRQSIVVATSDAATIDDLIGFAGVRRERTMTMPALLPSAFVDPVPRLARDGRKLVWLMEPSALHDVANAAEGLRLYLAEGGRLEPVIASETAYAGFEDAVSPALAALSPGLRRFLDDLPRQTVTSEAALSRIVANATMLWSSLLAGGDGEAAIAAARGGAHFVGLDFTVNRVAAEAIGQVQGLYARSRPIDIAEALHEAEERAGVSDPPALIPPDERSAVRGCGFLLDRLLEAGRA